MSKNAPEVGRSARRNREVTSAADTLKNAQPKDLRLTVRINSELKQKIHVYAITHNTSINTIISDLLTKFAAENIKDEQ